MGGQSRLTYLETSHPLWFKVSSGSSGDSPNFLSAMIEECLAVNAQPVENLEWQSLVNDNLRKIDKNFCRQLGSENPARGGLV